MPRPIETDEDLLRGAFAGDEGAFTSLVERFGAEIKAFALRMLRDEAEAEDVFSRTFLAVFRRREVWRPQGTVRGYLFTIARNRCLDILRKQRRHDAFSQDVLESQQGLGYSPSPEAQAILREDTLRLEAALSSLPPTHREVLLLRLVHGMSGEETAQILGIQEEQVRSQLSYARKILRTALGETQPRAEAQRTLQPGEALPRTLWGRS